MRKYSFLLRNVVSILLITLVFISVSCKDKKKDLITNVTDKNGNKYKVVVIDEKYWMAANLKCTTTKSGQTITLATAPTQWSTTQACCSWYAYNPSYQYYQDCGLLYNSVAMKANPCPDGWRLPSASEWNSMIKSLGGANIAGGKLKSTNNFEYWIGNTGATNSTGFNAYGSGFSNNGNCLGYRSSAHYWTSDMALRELAANSTVVSFSTGSTANGYSIRCVKNID